MFVKLLNLPLLQVLKLRGVHMRDKDFFTLAQAVNIRLRSLDVRDNYLTDQSVRALLSFCIVPTDTLSFNQSHEGSFVPFSAAVEDSRPDFGRPDPAILDECQDESYDDRFVWRLTSHVVGRLPFEDLPHSGLTHLRIADNLLSIEGLAALLRSKRLCVLDVGSINVGESLRGARLNSLPASGTSDDCHLRLHSVRSLASVLRCYSPDITSLRIDHTFVTEKATPQEDNLSFASGELSIDGPASGSEVLPPSFFEIVDTQPPLYETFSQEPVPHYQLTGEMEHPAHQRSDEKSQACNFVALGGRKESTFAPEVLKRTPEEFHSGESELGVNGFSPSMQGSGDVHMMVNLFDSLDDDSISKVSQDNYGTSIELYHKQRMDLRRRQLSNGRGFISGNLPKLRTLILTRVPCYVKTWKVVDALINLIKDCAAEARLADLQARLEASAAIKAGHARTPHCRHKNEATFALRRIVLEFGPDELFSAIEDTDTEALWAASEGDFTFFNDGEECVSPSSAMNVHATMSYKLTMFRKTQKEAFVDVRKELSRFRAEQKIAHENALKQGLKYVDGYWPGEINIIRGHYFHR